jgi:hypothetical protein
MGVLGKKRGEITVISHLKKGKLSKFKAKNHRKCGFIKGKSPKK